MDTTQLLKRALYVVAIAAIGVGAYYFYTRSQEKIVPYDAQKHRQFILASFAADWYWLVDMPREEYALEDVIDKKTRPYHPESAGKVQISVMEVKGVPAGFVIYYVALPPEGELVYLFVNKQFRRRKIAQKLLAFLEKEFVRQGATYMKFLTRVTNIPAQTLYVKQGFVEYSRNDRYVYYVKLLVPLAPATSEHQKAPVVTTT